MTIMLLSELKQNQLREEPQVEDEQQLAVGHVSDTFRLVRSPNLAFSYSLRARECGEEQESCGRSLLAKVKHTGKRHIRVCVFVLAQCPA